MRDFVNRMFRFNFLAKLKLVESKHKIFHFLAVHTRERREITAAKEAKITTEVAIKQPKISKNSAPMDYVRDGEIQGHSLVFL